MIGRVSAFFWMAAVPVAGLTVGLKSESRSAFNVDGSATHLVEVRTPAQHRGASNSSQEPRVPPALGSSSSGTVQGPLGSQGEPRLFFLFMVYAKINNEEIWDRFFDAGVQGVDYTALVHCKSESGCRKNIRSQTRFQIIKSVETTYCFDLVSGMNALLKAALATPGRQDKMSDKFIFISDSTLPVKPFSVVKHRLTSVVDSSASNFCIFPRNEWAEVSSASPNHRGLIQSVQAAVKHHQWIILSRSHATKILENAAINSRQLAREFEVLTGGRAMGCLDEFWYFAKLFGTVDVLHKDTVMNLQGLAGGPLQKSNYEIQGQCDTFVMWMPRASGITNNITGLMQDLQSDIGVDMTPADNNRPGKIHRFSKQSLMKFRASWFLFARKVDEGAKMTGCRRLVDVFDKLVFKTPPETIAPDPTWRGQGTWSDTRSAPVTITSNDGSLEVKGTGSGMSAKGSYCNDNIEVVFSNGYRAVATLSSDGATLQWNTGVSWRRSVVPSHL